jgi:dihydroorotase
VKKGVLPERRLVEALTIGPARAFGLAAGTLARGAAADVAVLDPAAEWTVEPDKLHSKGKNTPWKGKRLPGRCVYTIVGGRIVHGESRTDR